jgi:hypothetical protein
MFFLFPFATPPTLRNRTIIFVAHARGYAEICDKPAELSEAGRVREATCRMASAIFNAGGSLEMIAHPSTTSLVAHLCAQYQQPEPIESFSLQKESLAGPTLRLWSSDGDEASWHVPSEAIRRLRGIQTEYVESQGTSRSDSRSKSSEAQKIIDAIIKKKRPIGMMIIGFDSTAMDALKAFRTALPTAPIYLLATPGGVVAELKETFVNIQSYDYELVQLLRNVRKDLKSEVVSGVVIRRRKQEEEMSIPYGCVASRIVEDLVKWLDQGEKRLEDGR